MGPRDNGPGGAGFPRGGRHPGQGRVGQGLVVGLLRTPLGLVPRHVRQSTYPTLHFLIVPCRLFLVHWISLMLCFCSRLPILETARHRCPALIPHLPPVLVKATDSPNRKAKRTQNKDGNFCCYFDISVSVTCESAGDGGGLCAEGAGRQHRLGSSPAKLLRQPSEQGTGAHQRRHGDRQRRERIRQTLEGCRGGLFCHEVKYSCIQ